MTPAPRGAPAFGIRKGAFGRPFHFKTPRSPRKVVLTKV